MSAIPEGVELWTPPALTAILDQAAKDYNHPSFGFDDLLVMLRDAYDAGRTQARGTDMTYPMTTPERAARREAIRARWMAEAERTADFAVRSLKCAGSITPAQHADMEGGCRNDGSGCLCACHDPGDTAW